MAFLAGEPAAAPVERLLRDRQDPPTLSVVNLAEVLDVLVRIYGFPVEAVVHRLDLLSAGPVAIVEADEFAGRLAGDLRSRYYRRNDTAISLADCFALATASLLDVPLATADPALARVAGEEGVEVVRLPNSAGRLPA